MKKENQIETRDKLKQYRQVNGLAILLFATEILNNAVSHRSQPVPAALREG